MFCSKCGASNGEDAMFCAKCGFKIAAPPVPGASEFNAPAVAGSASKQPGFDTEAWKSVIGPRNTDYYLSRFTAQHTGGKGSFWHWPAFFFTFYWLLYRKQWLWAAIYFIAPYLIAVALAIAIGAMGSTGTTLAAPASLGYLAAIFLIPALFANSLYYKRCRALIERQKVGSQSREQYLARLEAHGGTSRVAAIAVGIVVVIGIVGVLAAIALPAYDDYTKRAKASEAIVVAMGAARQVGEHYERNGTLPSSLADLSSPPAPSKYISDLRLSQKGGTIEVDIRFSPTVSGTVYLIPALDSNGKVTWKCKAAPEVRRIVPLSCREE